MKYKKTRENLAKTEVLTSKLSKMGTIDYSQSEIKYVVDAWKLAKTPAALYTRLITIDDLIDNLGYSWDITSDGKPVVNDDVPVWVYNNNYSYLTMSQYNDSTYGVWIVNNVGTLGICGRLDGIQSAVVRPVIVLYKSAID